MQGPSDFFSDVQVARMLAHNPVTIRKWRTKNKAAGCIKFGPPYEYRGANVVYPKAAFYEWCGKVQMVNGVPHTNLPVGVPMPLPTDTVAA